MTRIAAAITALGGIERFVRSADDVIIIAIGKILGFDTGGSREDTYSLFIEALGLDATVRLHRPVPANLDRGLRVRGIATEHDQL